MASIPTWHITSQAETAGDYGNGQFGQGVRITFQTVDGLTGSVFVPISSYTKANVQKLVAEKVALMADIQSMQG